jgi:cobalamin synthase
MTTPITPQPNPWGYDMLIHRLYAFVDSLNTSRRKTYGISWLVIAVLLATAASLPLPDGLRWVSVLVGWPAGVIAFALALALVHGTDLKNNSIFEYKERVPPKKRVSAVIIGLVVVAAILISTSSFLPSGVGGVIIIFSALLAYNVIRRTPEEMALAAQGLPDPREIPEEIEE